MFVHRDIEPELIQLAKDYPVVTITGPRQSGKTTLVREVFSEMAYINLERPDTRELVEYDPLGFLEQYPNGIILDEIQRLPNLLSYIQTIVDESKQKGQFILTGSHQLELQAAVSQSLAGRTALLNLLPLSISELNKADIQLSTGNQYLLNGFFPRIYSDSLDSTKVYRNYLHTYIERDVRALINLKDLSSFQKFMRLCAGRVGQIVNNSSLANEVGVSAHTIANWLSILEASFIVHLLVPYYENFGKRVIKSPKLYFTDVGLASYLLGLENLTQVARDPLRGSLFENLVIMELLKTRYNQGKDANLYYFRDSHGNEIDVVYKQANDLTPIEIKSSKTLTKGFFKGLEYFSNLAGEKYSKGFLVYSGEKQQHLTKVSALNYRDAHKIVE